MPSYCVETLLEISKEMQPANVQFRLILPEVTAI
jgi:hypothetical protein